jgi:autotransporter-associated beta strand protein
VSDAGAGKNLTITNAGTTQFSTVNISGNISANQVAFTTNQLAITGNLAPANSASFTINGYGNLNGILSGTGVTLTKAGIGTLTLSGLNTYTGATAINAGTIRLGTANAFSSASDLTIASGAVFDLSGYSTTVGSLAGAGSVNSTPNPYTNSNLVLALDASNPASYSGTGSTWYNLVDSTANATIINAPTFSASGKYFTLNGTNQYFDLGTPQSLLLNGTSKFTMNVWVSIPSWQYQQLISKQNGGKEGDYALAVNGNGTVLAHREVSPWDTTTTSTVTTNQLTQVSMVYDGTTLGAYINGVLQSSITSGNVSTGAGSPSNLMNTLIGAGFNSNTVSYFSIANIYKAYIFHIWKYFSKNIYRSI